MKRGHQLQAPVVKCEHQPQAPVKSDHQPQIPVKQSQDPEEVIVRVQKYSLKRCDFFTLNDMVC